MLHSECKIGTRFDSPTWPDGPVWICTDVGSRVIVAIEYKADWMAGPPYAVQEVVLDENDLPAFSACPEQNGGGVCKCGRPYDVTTASKCSKCRRTAVETEAGTIYVD